MIGSFKINMFLVFILCISFSCRSYIYSENQNHLKEVKLDFSDCVIAFDDYSDVSLKIPRGYSRNKITKEGLCEYRFSYRDSSVFYVSSDVWFGSRLNFVNRDNINHTAYTKEALNDTIAIEGKQPNNRYWKEHILGNIMIGYVNVTTDKKLLFDEISSTINKK